MSEERTHNQNPSTLRSSAAHRRFYGFKFDATFAKPDHRPYLDPPSPAPYYPKTPWFSTILVSGA